MMAQPCTQRITVELGVSPSVPTNSTLAMKTICLKDEPIVTEQRLPPIREAKLITPVTLCSIMI